MASPYVRTAGRLTQAPAEPLALLDDLRTLVTVTRTHSKDIQIRQVYVRLDGSPPTSLLYGESFTLEVQPGRHRLFIHNTLFWKRVTFHVEPGEHLEFMLINRGGRFTYPLVALLGVAPLYLTVQQRSVR
jgi:hypothetical protein